MPLPSLASASIISRILHGSAGTLETSHIARGDLGLIGNQHTDQDQCSPAQTARCLTLDDRRPPCLSPRSGTVGHGATGRTPTDPWRLAAGSDGVFGQARRSSPGPTALV